MPQASPVWQTAFLVWSLVCIGWMIFSGWRAGFIRAVFSLGGLLLGYLVGGAAAGAVPEVLIAALPLPGVIARLAAGMLAGLAVFIGIWIFSAALFKRTSQQRSLLMRLIWGSGGAVFGLIFGLVVVVALVTGIRIAGAVAETRLEQSLHANPNQAQTGVVPGLVKLKRSIEAGETGTWIKSFDLTPDSTYRVLTKVSRILSDRDALRRLGESPAISELLLNRDVVNLGADPDVNEAIRTGNYGWILSNPKFLQAVKNPELVAKMQKIDWESELDRALTPAPVPSPLSPPEN